MQETNQSENIQPTYNASIATEPVKKPVNKWLFIFLGLLLLGGFGIFMFTRSGGTADATPTPAFGVVPVDETTPTQAPTPTPAPVNKDEVSIEIQNGTGITGEAAYLQNKLKTLGYSDISVGNADSTDYQDTTVTFSKNLSTTAQEEIKKELEGIYKKVVVKTSSTQTKDMIVVTGVRSGVSAKPTSTSKSTTKASATPTSKASGSPSASPKASATPTSSN